MFILVITLFSAICIELCTSVCLPMPSSLYCTNLENNTDNKILISYNDTNLQKNDIQVIYLRNSSGEIDQNTFSNFSKMKSLDIQFSSIDNFSLKPSAIDILYLMYNLKFPTLSAELMKQCCQNVSIIFIVNNKGMDIEDGVFRHMPRLTHLTISKQNVTKLTRNFFEGLEELTYLNLKDNGILEIDKNAFENLTELSHLILSYNSFTTLDPLTLRNLKVLEAIELYGLNLNNSNISIFNNQKELKELDLPTALINKELELKEIINVFPKLETFGFQDEDKEDIKVAEFIGKCKATGYKIKFSNRSEL